MLRFSLYRLVVLMCVGIILYTTVRWWQIIFGQESTVQQFQHTCNMTEKYRHELERLFERVHRLLVQHKLTHFLCYGTLWGQIRMGKMLPWREKAEFCVLNDELMHHEEARFIRNFYANELHISYLHSEGIYRIFATDSVTMIAPPYIELIVFQLDVAQGMYKRVGWKRRLLPPHCDWTPSLDCFPVNLLQGTLPKRPLGRLLYTVPMGGIELQKYHYRDNWWKDVKVHNCNLN
ncbi:uncharacterized protein LOC131282127 [Anopheles ziemanni]|uniref:uncharacterized protein LOC131265602 n=1 Tax=Anopheles coustani TaxID=139045 RepID=UPI002659F685|nr:uncharacterized protein LOC131265602 [Anopheles coustani]XP_058167506.1 uncharacterized protein LOC131282127 [Anopheles ziemanni]